MKKTNPQAVELEETLRRYFGTQVKIKQGPKGYIEIEYYSRKIWNVFSDCFYSRIIYGDCSTWNNPRVKVDASAACICGMRFDRTGFRLCSELGIII